MSSNPSIPIAAAVYLGALILFGIPAFILSLTVIGGLLEVSGIESVLDEYGFLEMPLVFGILLIALLAGMQIAYEIAMLQLHGLEALHRGSPRIALLRHALLLLGGLALLAVVAIFGIEMVRIAEHVGVMAVGLLLTVLAILGGIRASLWFYQGYTDPSMR